MHALEFTTELNGSNQLVVPADVVKRLPTHGKARILILTSSSDDDRDWQAGAYELFLKDDAPEDAIYDKLR